MKKIFFAIPCGDFYSNENRIIDDVCKTHCVEKVVIEEKAATSYLWKNITQEIDSSDLFVCDISSKSPNIVIELGYALKAKEMEKVAVFVSKNIEVFSDIKGIKYKEYTSYAEFIKLLEAWINEQLYSDTADFRTTHLHISSFHEEFRDWNKFLRLWSTPSGCQYNLASDGLHFTNCHMPIISNHLGLLRNYSFEFRAKLLSGAVGWIIKGTKEYDEIMPRFCLMFNIVQAGSLRPHIFNRDNIHPEHQYHPLEQLFRPLRRTMDPSAFYHIKTTVKDDLVEIRFDDDLVFSHTFGTHPSEQDLYRVGRKGGQVGFRCYPSEEAIIRDVNIELI
jgi:hypothetical protein